ncbi:hypothetical protein KJ865_16555, partial [Myxococcota bacterium]|nr:hypothetical protein [Myxococcota bacterium]
GEVSPASKNITGKATEKLIGTVKTMGKCTIRVERLVKIDHFRGPGPFSQSLRDQLKSNPRLARSYRGRSHGDRHLRCTYAITINDRHYTYAHHISNTLRQHTDARCSQKIDELLVHLFSVTDNCKDLNHGAYYGFHIKTGVR